MKFWITFIFTAILSVVISHYVSIALVWWSALIQPFTPIGKILLTWSIHIFVSFLSICYAWIFSKWLTDKNWS
ncbi:hypothetical protein [Bacillus toyonensis]|uniref:hypothetical protein n=1 Tax=Bacillus toyonensis TaxID=155322 RepID=UPI000BF16FE5|nr:hypothetical protein [Bacillus toyonensis]PEI73872.1 hypothetical protein CN674_12420 [Bacillus toyonensis]